MITPIFMLALMMTPAMLARIFSATTGNLRDTRAAGSIGLGLLFAFTASGHFIQTESMALMLPTWVPGRVSLVYATGLLEIAIAVAFWLPAYRKYAGWAAAVVLVAFFPANIYAALERVPFGGHAWGPVYLWIRAPVQIAILAWVVWCSIAPGRKLPVDAARGN
ncbi:hypothetical protein [Rhodoferax sp.]|uniref:DoxX family protein n=1 Tax=Rhodoferax sp. TaxID=50421 RepID=UPI0025F68E14|nr:hypothetical protein [Rhodoferax sp.]MCM2339528.1 hypothetical protein [Rhodoferax sp.]